MLIGRSLLKIENETGRHSVFNTLKNQGYHFERNRAAYRYGHGKNHLSTVMAYLIDLFPNWNLFKFDVNS